MIEVRAAGPDDAAELVRLRGVLLTRTGGRAPAPGEWQRLAAQTLRERLAGPDTDATMAAYVVDAPDRPGALVACAVGTIESRLGGPENPSGRVGYLFNVATDPGHRRRGYARACVAELLSWYRRRDVRKIDLSATAEAEPLYRSLGFTRRSEPAMRLTSGRSDSGRSTAG
ncbi:GNAT family N-acetyltransferase [Micromonospora zhanjiangensis]|uniref:GNAT family N-acetyltransferase n=1 Tax=Micromonospora zhanjiangensis TaxID=1522057 RepID=A0ABV8KX48_9ACTN